VRLEVGVEKAAHVHILRDTEPPGMANHA
jgi:hypothetical protein